MKKTLCCLLALLLLFSSALADTLITAVSTVDGAEVDSIRPFSGRVDRRGQIRMLAEVAAHRQPRDFAAFEPLLERGGFTPLR